MNKDDFNILNFFILCVIALVLATAVKSMQEYKKTSPLPEPAQTYIPQFVLISFDGSRSNVSWKDLRLLKDELRASSTPLHLTHFINAAYFLTSDTKHLYKGPGHKTGKSDIGFSEDIEHLRTRINEVNMAIADGDEIASHTVGHFSGAGWSKDEWKEEFVSFDKIMFDLDNIYPDAHLPRLALATSSVIGFRAPYLDKSPGLYEALHDIHARYDSSEIARNNEWPTKDADGMWHIPLGVMKLGQNQSNILAMDYNIYFRDSQALDTIKKGTPEWQRVYDDTLAAFLGYFNKNYSGNRAPVLVGYHFSQGWNDGVYWEVMKDFARQVCGKPEVRCGTFRDLVNYMDKYGVPAAAQSEKLTASAYDAVEPEGAREMHDE